VKPHVVRQGDTISRIAARYGVAPREVWEHPANRELRERRPNPEVLAPGDVLRVPDVPLHVGLAPVSPGGTHRFRARVPRLDIQLVLRGGGGPNGELQGQDWEIDGPSGIEPQQGRTGADGVVRFAVPIHVSEVDLVLIGRDEIVPIRIGHLDPADERSGARQRLVQLGYLLPPVAELFGAALEDVQDGFGDDDTAYAAALRAFQRDRGLEHSGVLDAATAHALRQAYGA
jgi:hypothetical protein